MVMDMYSLTDNMILLKIGEFVRRQRLDRNISQKELANSAGASISSVAALERGESVSLKTLIPLLRALGVLHMFADFHSTARHQHTLPRYILLLNLPF